MCWWCGGGLGFIAHIDISLDGTIEDEHGPILRLVNGVPGGDRREGKGRARGGEGRGDGRAKRQKGRKARGGKGATKLVGTSLQKALPPKQGPSATKLIAL